MYMYIHVQIYLSINISICVSVYLAIYILSINLSIYLSLYLSICLSINLSISALSVYLSIFLCFCLFVNLYIYICLSVSLCVCLSVSLSLCLSVSLSLCLSVSLSLSLSLSSALSASLARSYFLGGRKEGSILFANGANGGLPPNPRASLSHASLLPSLRVFWILSDYQARILFANGGLRPPLGAKQNLASCDDYHQINIPNIDIFHVRRSGFIPPVHQTSVVASILLALDHSYYCYSYYYDQVNFLIQIFFDPYP